MSPIYDHDRYFAFTYDPMNRLTSAKYREKTSSSWNVNTSRYDVTNLIYDRNGNIKSLQRKGMTNPVADPPAYGVMDNLSYTYENSGKSNRLQRINDAGVKTAMTGVEHFVDGNTSNTDYLYDNSGNLKQDLNKGISSIVYNHLNKPTTITFSNGKKIQYIYDASGAKLRQKVFGNGGSSTTVETDYVGPFHYEDADGDGSGATTAILFFSHEEGRVRRAGSDLIYETFLKDHLGNVRVMFADMDGNGAVSPDPVNGEVLQVDHFYPFGLRMAGLSLVPGVKNSYLFTGKEAQDELGLGWIDFGARMYDAASSRWNGVDALADSFPGWSPYNYVMNSPLVLTDPDGRDTFRIHIERIITEKRAVLYQATFSVIINGKETTFTAPINSSGKNDIFLAQSNYGWDRGGYNRLSKPIYDISYVPMSRHSEWENTIQVTGNLFIHEAPVTNEWYSTGCLNALCAPSDAETDPVVRPENGLEESQEALSIIREMHDSAEDKAADAGRPFGFQLITNSRREPQKVVPAISPIRISLPTNPLKLPNH